MNLTDFPRKDDGTESAYLNMAVIDSVKLNSLDLQYFHRPSLYNDVWGGGTLYNFVFTEFPIKAVSGDVTGFHTLVTASVFSTNTSKRGV